MKQERNAQTSTIYANHPYQMGSRAVLTTARPLLSAWGSSLQSVRKSVVVLEYLAFQTQICTKRCVYNQVK